MKQITTKPSSKGKRMLTFCLIVLIFAAAATLEVVGDARIRYGMEHRSLVSGVALGLLALCVYGILINLVIYFKIVQWGFSKQLGVYVALFAIASTFIGYRFFGEKIPVMHLAGLGLILVGGVLIAAQE
jgi:small multidrug resistance family-3 protein